MAASEAERVNEDDQELTRRILAGDEAAFDEFGERTFPALYRFALARTHGDGELARDLVQATMAKALAKLDSYRGDSSLLTWLCACLRNELLMHFRGQRGIEVEWGDAVEREAERVVEGSEAGRNPELHLLREERRARVHGVLDALPGHYARALEWKYVEQLPVVEIARRLGLAAKAAESLLTRARIAFRRSYEELEHA